MQSSTRGTGVWHWGELELNNTTGRRVSLLPLFQFPGLLYPPPSAGSKQNKRGAINFGFPFLSLLPWVAQTWRSLCLCPCSHMKALVSWQTRRLHEQVKGNMQLLRLIQPTFLSPSSVLSGKPFAQCEWKCG